MFSCTKSNFSALLGKIILKFNFRPYSDFIFGGRNRRPKAENFRFRPKVSAFGRPLYLEYTLYNTILRIARTFLETRENIKILTHPFYHTNLDWFSWEWSKKKIFFFGKKNPKWPFFKNGHFSKSPILKIFSWKFHRFVLGLVGLHDAKGIDLAQRIWSWGCPT